jgi:N,N'-diacetylchitobiose non-reducing end deacetylase
LNLPPPVPDLLEARHVLAVQPHYDDNDIAAGGTLAALRDRGARITYATVSDDLAGVLDPELSDALATEQLRREQWEAAAHIGVEAHHWLGHPDAGAWDVFALRSQLIRLMRSLRPDFVLTCDPWLPYEMHPDHVRTGLAVAEAACLQGLPRIRTDPEADAGPPHAIRAVAFYWSAAPNTRIGISGSRERKHRALACYRSQLREEDLRTLGVALERQEREWARGTPWGHVEAFKVLRPAALHCNPAAARS